MTANRRGRARIGTSGYQYDHWQGVFYPDELPSADRFGFYAQHFDTVEINNTFYHLPQRSTFDAWREAAPSNFCYTLKFSRYGSHLKCLKDPEATIGAFMENAERLGPLLGPTLVQLKPNWKADPERLRHFLRHAPADRRWAVEFRHPSWLCDDVYDILRAANAALCIHDMIENHPRPVTADWVYWRFHGNGYAGSYSHQFLRARADNILEHIENGRDVYAYFNNDADGHAVHNARDMKRFVESDT